MRRIVITGGAGFIGSNLADRLLSDRNEVVLFDNLSRPGVERNLDWLRRRHGRVRFLRGDVRDPAALRLAVDGARAVYHLAAQVAVTQSLVEPVADFEVNARGTLNLLEAVRAQSEPPIVVFTSTNKVYGALSDIELASRGHRWEAADDHLRAHGISEARALDFHSPYGCSKGAADQYVLDYARCYGLRTCVLRVSCVYGPRQLGCEDQGWVAHFFRRALSGAPITLYGDGRQLRDLLFVDDFVEALLAAVDRIAAVSGCAFNLGGGPSLTLGLLELIDAIARYRRATPEVQFGPPRVGDQRWYVSDTRRFQHATGWRPGVPLAEGLGRLFGWLATLDAPALPEATMA